MTSITDDIIPAIVMNVWEDSKVEGKDPCLFKVFLKVFGLNLVFVENNFSCDGFGSIGLNINTEKSSLPAKTELL